MIARIVSDMGGWIEFCHMPKDKLAFAAHEFQRRYAAFLIHKAPDCPPYFTGALEQHNRLSGYLSPPPVTFGEKQVGLLISHNYRRRKAHD